MAKLEEKITKIAGMVYEVDPDDPDITYFAIIEEIKALVAQERAEIKEWVKANALKGDDSHTDGDYSYTDWVKVVEFETYLNHKNNKKENENV